MTTNLPAERKPQFATGAPVAALVPRSLDEAYRLAGALAASGMAPRGMDKPEQIMVAIMAGAELGLAPFQALQSFAVINGRPAIWGDGLMAVVRARGVKVKEWLSGEGDAMVAHCLATRPDTGEEVEREFSVADAKKASLWGKTGPWSQHPKRMLQMRARAFALRDGCADMLRGIAVREEVDDYQNVRDVTPRPSGLRERLGGPSSEGFNASQAEDPPAVFVDHAEEIIEADLNVDPPADDGLPVREDDAPDDDFPGDRLSTGYFDVLAWADELEKNLPDYASVDVMRLDWNDHKAALNDRDPLRCKTLNQAIARRAAEIGQAAARSNA